MKKINLNIFEFIKYLLFFILAILSVYLILLTQGLITRPYPPRNSLEVSPLSGNSITTQTSSDIIYNIKYEDSNIFELYKIYDNEIVFETYDATADILKYTASSIYNIGSHPSISYLGTDDVNEFPNLSFINYSNKNNYKFENSNSDVFIEYSDDVATSFVYTSGLYKYINSVSQQSEHVDTGHGLTFSNIIVQFIDDNNKAEGTGIVFSGGISQKIVWKHNLFMFEKDNSPLTLNQGKSIWITLKTSDKEKLIYNS
ncbi:MAG: DUF3048 C-terminal domain-containing protein [Sarcina sp.]